VIRRLRLDWPAPAGAVPEETRPIRLLAVSDERVATLDHKRNRDALGRVDAVFGCGDLEPDYLAFVADAFGAPLLYVRGNHDRDAGWGVGSELLPEPLENRLETIEGVTIAGLSWPGKDRGRAERDGTAAWLQAAGLVAKAKLAGRSPEVVISHVPPRGLGDAPEDDYHRGFSAYYWLCRTLNPRLWLHGHTTAAATTDWRTTWGTTTLVNVTGGVLLELVPAPRPATTAAAGTIGRT
jgi:Icc-related predicted phosphoesterase